jgi:signal transduction histidine kinase
VAVDGVLALALCAFALLGAGGAAETQQAPRALDAGAYLLIVLACAPLVLRRTRPMWSLVATTAAVAGFVVAGYPFGPIMIALFVAMYSVASGLPMSRSLPVCAANAAAAGVALLVRHILDPAPMDLEGLIPFTAFLVVPWSVGTVVRLRRDIDTRTRREVAHRAAMEERLRVAREVHDVAGHGLSVIAMQAGVALHVLDRRPEQARVALEEIRAASRESLDGLRASLEVFQRPVVAADRRPPAVGLGDLDGLVARMRQAGLGVDLVVSGDRRPLPPDADLAAYRIVQESLTNVLRHADATRARVSLDYADGALSVEVVDDGSPAADRGADVPPGHGIVGMRDRATAAGGTLEAGPRPGGGFRVRARLPVASPS